MKKLKSNIKEALDLLGIFILAGVLTFFVGHYYNKAMHGLGNESTDKVTTSTSKPIKTNSPLIKENE